MRVSEGVLSFDQSLFESSELLNSDSEFEFVDVHDQLVALPLPAGSFAYTICQVPVIYHSAAEPKLLLKFRERASVARDPLSLTEAETASLFSRRGEISSIEVHFNLESCS